MAKQKIRACRKCRLLHEEEKCPKCGSQSYTEGWKGRIEITDAENSEIAKQLRLTEKGVYAIKSD